MRMIHCRNASYHVTLAVYFLVFTNGCGTIVGNPTKPGTDSGGGTSKFVSDTTLTAGIVNSHVDDVADAIGEESSALTAGSLTLNDLSFVQSEYAKSCETSGQSVVATRAFSGARTDTFQKFKRQFTRSREGVDSYKISWSKSGSSLRCSSNGGNVALIDFSQSADLIQESKIERNLTVTLTNDTAGTVVRKRKWKVFGDRKFTWAGVIQVAGVSTVQRSGSWQITREDESTTKSGNSDSVQTKSRVEAANPIVTETSWDSGGPQNWKDRSIKSGELVNEHDDGSIIKLAFEQLKFQKATGCSPISGTVSGKLFNHSQDVEPALTFTISFENGSGTILWSNGDRANYTSSGCSLDE